MQHRSIQSVVVVVSAVLAVLNGDPCAAQGTFRVSVDAQGGEARGWSWYPSISADGRYVCFASRADNLVANDTNSTSDVFVKDRISGAVERVSISTNGQETPSWSGCGATAISADGRIVAFESTANNLASPASWSMRIFLRDRLTGITSVISPSSTTPANGECLEPSISADGRFVAFYSDANNLVPNDTNGWPDAFVFDRQSGVITRVSVDSNGVEGNGIFTWPARVSGDGRFVAFHSYASDLVPGDTNGVLDCFLHDLATGTTKRVSVDSEGREVGARQRFWINDIALSGDGRFVGFDHDAPDLVPGDTNGTWDIFVHGPYLSLEAAPEAVPAGAPLTLTTWTGLPGDPALLSVVDVNGAPTFWPVATGRFDRAGAWAVTGTPPAALGGSVITFLTLALAPTGRLDQTDLQVVTLQ